MPAVGASAALPSIISAAGAIGGSLLGRKSVQGSTQMSPAELQAQQGQLGQAGQLSKLGGQLGGMGTANLSKAGGYFSSLAGGNRASTAQTLAPDVSNINSVYGGTARTLGRFLRGPEAGVQGAEAERERAGQIGRLFGGARSGANSALAGLGAGEVGAGASASQGAGGLFASVGAQGQSSRFGGAQLEHQAGSDFGGLMFNLLKQYSGRSAGGGMTGNLPSRSTVSPMGFLPQGGTGMGG